MSDEFIKLATKEINEEISGIENILNLCTDDSGIFQSSEKFQKHTHKIKGLAPMMGKGALGNLASTLDDILKQIMAGKTPQGIFDLMKNSLEGMVQSSKSDFDLEPISEESKLFLSNI